jgi:hypothetical protein
MCIVRARDYVEDVKTANRFENKTGSFLISLLCSLLGVYRQIEIEWSAFGTDMNKQSKARDNAY